MSFCSPCLDRTVSERSLVYAIKAHLHTRKGAQGHNAQGRVQRIPCTAKGHQRPISSSLENYSDRVGQWQAGTQTMASQSMDALQSGPRRASDPNLKPVKMSHW